MFKRVPYSGQQDIERSRSSRPGGAGSRQEAIPAQPEMHSRMKIGSPEDKYEQEADRVADTVMRMPDPQVHMQAVQEEEEGQLQMQPKQGVQIQLKHQVPELQRMCPRCRERAKQGKPLNCGECEQKLQMTPPIQQKNHGPTYVSPEITSQLHASNGQGASLPTGVQREMSHKIGADFSDVTVHTNSKSHQLNEQLGAKAFTHGNDIYFNKGEYNPKTTEGRHLLAHELVHVIQQATSPDTSYIQRACVDGSWQYEYDGCSVPPSVADQIGADHKDNPAGGSDTHFARPNGSRDQPCDRHDECYQTCHGTPGAKLMCDWRMYDDMLSVCENSHESEQVKERCKRYAWIYFNGLMDFATTAFLERQQQVCSCEGENGLMIEEHLSGFRFPLGVTIPLGKNAILNIGGGTFRPPSPGREGTSLVAGGQLIWRF